MRSRATNPKLISAAHLHMLQHEYQVAWAARDLEKSEAVLEKVLQINPRNSNALLLLGRLHGVCYAYDEALECFDKAVKVAPASQRPSVLIEAGMMSRDFIDPSIAESLFQDALKEARSTAAKLALAQHSIRMRKRESARELVEQMLRDNPRDPHASLLWCRLHEDDAQGCRERLTMLMGVKNDELRIKVAYQLARTLDLAGDYEGAMQALLEAKGTLMRARNPIVTHRRKMRVRYEELAAGFTDSKRSEWQSAASDFGEPRKLALLGGHPRSGTTLLEQVLDSHPGIISAEETENFNIFAYSPLARAHPNSTGILEILDTCPISGLLSARQNYFDMIDKCLGENVGSRLLVDKNPSLTPLSPALLRIFPEINFVTMIRDPRDVILSCYMQSFFPPDAISGNFLTLEDTAIEYAAFMGVWLEISKRLEDRVCEVRYEDMVEDLQGKARKVLDFLGLDWDESVMEYDRHAREKVVRSPTADAVTEKVHGRAKARWKHYEKHLEPVLETLAPSLKALGYE